jgi:nucleoside-diphosphate-sugar epimerase
VPDPTTTTLGRGLVRGAAAAHRGGMSDSPVLVTGGSGFIGGHVVLQLLDAGHTVRATTRSLDREPAVRAALAAAGMTRGDALRLVEADLTSDDGWAAAVDGVDAVVHVASPVAPGHVEDEQSLIGPARDGALRVLRAARAAGVRRVVLTSAFHAVAWGHGRDERVFTEADWTDVDGPGVDAYGKSKTLAERAAWDFVADGGPELVTLLPVAVMGPVLAGEVSGANNVVRRLLTGQVSAYPSLHFPVVDVRDVALAHALAVTAPVAGERLLLSSDPAMAMERIGALLREHLGEAAGRVPTASVPDEVLRASAAGNPALQAMLPDLGYVRRMSHEKATRLLDWHPRPSAEAVVAAGESMVAAGLV